MSKISISLSAAVAGFFTGHHCKREIIIYPVAVIVVLITFISTVCNGQAVQLTPPLPKYPSVFFKDAVAAELKFAWQGWLFIDEIKMVLKYAARENDFI